MCVNFVSTVHVAPPVVQVPPYKYHFLHKKFLLAPVAMRASPIHLNPLQEQIEEAAQNPSSFEGAMYSILKTNLYFLKDPEFRKDLCSSVYSGSRCYEGRFCKHAGSLAELYANNIYRNPHYKTKLCKFKNRCRYGSACWYGHPGDLMRKVVQIGNRVFTKQWYTAPIHLE